MAVRQATRRFATIPEFLAEWEATMSAGALALGPGDLDGEAAPDIKIDIVLPIVGRLGPTPAQVVSRAPDGSTFLRIPTWPRDVKRGIDALLGGIEEIRQHLIAGGDLVARSTMEQAVVQGVEAVRRQAEEQIRQLRRELSQRPAGDASSGSASTPVLDRPGGRGFAIPDVSGQEPSFEGALSDRSLRDTMVQMAIHRSTGMLVIIGEDDCRRFGFWERGGPVGWRLEPIDQRSVLGVLLYRAGKVDREQLKQSLAMMEEQGIRQGEALIQLGVLNFPQLVMSLQKQVELHLQKVMRVSQGVWAFFELESLPERFITPPLNVPSILFRALLGYSRELSMEQIAAAHRPNMDRYLYFSDGVEDVVAEINFKAAERKFLEIMASNSWRMRELFSVSNLSRTDTSAVIWALSEMGFLDFRTEETVERFLARVGQRIKQKSDQVKGGSAFDVLELHWICLQHEVEHHYARIKEEFAGPEYQQLPPEMTQKIKGILASVEEAYALLLDQRNRRALREEIIESDMVIASADMLSKKGEMAILKGDRRGAVDCWSKAVEIMPEAGAYREGLNRARGL